MSKRKSDLSALIWILKQIKPQLLGLAVLTLMNLLIAGASTYTALQSKKVIDSILETKDITAPKIYHTIIIYLVIIIGVVLCNFMSGLLNDILKFKTTIQLQNHFVLSLMTVDYQRIAHLHSGKINTYLYSDIPYIANALTTIAPHFVNMSTRLITALYLLFILDKLLAMILVFFGCCLLLGIFFLSQYSRKLYNLVQNANAKTRSMIQDSITNLLAIKIFQKSMVIASLIEKLQEKEYQIAMKRTKLSQFSSLSFSFVYQIGYLVVLIWGGYRISINALSLGSLTALIQLSGQVQAPIVNIAGLIPFMSGFIESSKRIKQVIDSDFIIPNTPLTQTDIRQFKKIQIRDLVFYYDKKPILNHINFEINKGEIVAITGKSGSGKTTLILLILGVIKTNEDIQIYFGQNEKKSPADVFEPLFSFVPQKELLFEGSIKDNITFFNPDTSDEQMIFAAKVAEAHDFISTLDHGYDTPISENGKGLSQGQAQRIAIARAICSNPEVLVLDEATSALDIETEKNVMKNIAQLALTTILITHRPNPLDIANRHFHIEKGNIINA